MWLGRWHETWQHQGLAPGTGYVCGKVQLRLKLPKDRLCLCHPLREVDCGKLLHLMAFGEEIAVLKINGPWLSSLLGYRVFSLKSTVMNLLYKCPLVFLWKGGSMVVRSQLTSKAQNVLKTTAPFCLPPPPPPPHIFYLSHLSFWSGLCLPWLVLKVEFS